MFKGLKNETFFAMALFWLTIYGVYNEFTYKSPFSISHGVFFCICAFYVIYLSKDRFGRFSKYSRNKLFMGECVLLLICMQIFYP